MRKRKILVVDDQRLNRAVLKEILEDEYDVLYAENGEEALHIIERERRRLSAILLDIVMPVMNGYEVLEEMNRRHLIKDIPVLVASQKFGDDSELKALSLGAKDYVAKPYNPDVLKRRVANIIQMHEALKQVDVLERDVATGLYNKSSFVKKAMGILEKYPNKDFDLIVMDIEHFRLFNSYYGFAEGDHLLRSIAESLLELLLNQVSVCAREYADNFLILCERKEDYIPDMKKCLMEKLDEYPSDIGIRLKFGVYQVEDHEMGVKGMCDRASCALRKAKGVYKRDIVYYDEKVEAEVFWEQQVTDDMELALRNAEFEVYIQPKYDVFTECMVGAEALVRWKHPQKGLISPDKFIPIFEENGFITDMDIYVWDKTCEMISQCMLSGILCVPVSVNVSRKDIYREDLLEVLLGLLKKYHIKQRYLHLEITESAYIENPEQLIKVAKELKNAGFVIEMDDFGSGYSSLNMLAKLPVDILKLDMKIIQSYGENSNARSIVNFIMGLAKWMNLYVVAEGVETKEQLEMLKRMDCNFAQGYYFAKPMPMDEFAMLLKTQKLADIPNLEDSSGKNAKILVREYDKEQIMLVIDDLAMNRAILADYFRDMFTIVEATNGDVALDYLDKGGNADIIMLDIYMPHMNGFEVLQCLKNNPKTADIPVIVSSQADDATIVKALKEGASDFIMKPFTKEDAFQCVNRVLTDLSNRIKKQDEEIRNRMNAMEKLATTDFLTGLWNRANFERLVKKHIQENPGKRCNFVMIDVDNFKNVNDKLGHLHGDRVLQEVARKLKRCFRDGDLICRMGGDEFAVFLMADITTKDLVERMDALHKCMDFDEDGIPISCSSGVSTYPQDGITFKELYESADQALFRAKRGGKNNCVIYEKK